MDDTGVNKAVEYLEIAQDRLFDKFYMSVSSGDYDSAGKCLDLLERLQLI